ncbi:3'-tRNA processing endoribonuclease [Apiospora aurea]|uniref:3'-tRNA processing endoribonuclease n=1 Tax=Apiospora aurea TaxID=335848 RepID=A0ABR1QZF6_9PEZI
MQDVLDQYVLAKTLLNLGGLVTVEDASREDFEPIGEDEVKDTSDGDVVAEKRRGREDSPDRSCPDWRHKPKSGQVHSDNRFLHTHVMHGLRPGDVVPLERIKASDMSAEAFACDHTIPCLGYVFRTTRQKLKPELRSTSQGDIKGLRESGVNITAPQTKPPAWLREGIPVVITECSFLWEEHRAQAERTKHTLWSDLEPVIRKFPQTTFVLIHFSMRYEEHDIREFFSKLIDPPKNIVVWIGDNQE